MKAILKTMILFTVLIVSCTNSPDMLTGIHPDGSCYREFTAMANPAFLTGDTTAQENPFPVEIDSTWKISWNTGDSAWHHQFPVKRSVIDSITLVLKAKNSTRDINHKKLLVMIHKDYKSVDDMAASFKFKKTHAWHDFQINYSIAKEFRWFYTYYTYREVYPKVKHNFTVPLNKYMSNDAISFWFTGQPNLTQGMNGMEIRDFAGQLEDQYNEWFIYNTWLLEFSALVLNYDQLQHQPVPKSRLVQLRDTIYNTEVKGKENDPDMEKTLNTYFKTKAFSILWKTKDSPMKKFEKALEDQNHIKYFTESFNYRLIMPGKVIHSSNAIASGDTLTWKLTAYRMVPSAYTIEAQSAKANIWAFILTGIVILIAIGSFVWKPKKRRN